MRPSGWALEPTVTYQLMTGSAAAASLAAAAAETSGTLRTAASSRAARTFGSAGAPAAALRAVSDDGKPRNSGGHFEGLRSVREMKRLRTVRELRARPVRRC